MGNIELYKLAKSRKNRGNKPTLLHVKMHYLRVET